MLTDSVISVLKPKAAERAFFVYTSILYIYGAWRKRERPLGFTEPGVFREVFKYVVGRRGSCTTFFSYLGGDRSNFPLLVVGVKLQIMLLCWKTFPVGGGVDLVLGRGHI